MRFCYSAFLLTFAVLAAAAEPKQTIQVQETDAYIQIDSDVLQARIRKKGYVSGVARNSRE